MPSHGQKYDAQRRFRICSGQNDELILSSHVRKGTYAVTQAKDNLLTIMTTTGASDSIQKTECTVRVFAEALELTDVKNQITRRLVRGAPPTPGAAQGMKG